MTTDCYSIDVLLYGYTGRYQLPNARLMLGVCLYLPQGDHAREYPLGDSNADSLATAGPHGANASLISNPNLKTTPTPESEDD